MKMWGIVIIVEDFDQNAEEAADIRHALARDSIIPVNLEMAAQRSRFKISAQSKPARRAVLKELKERVP
jgi:hypothetical protein